MVFVLMNTVHVYISVHGHSPVFKNVRVYAGMFASAFLMNARLLNGKAPFRSDL